MTLSIEDLANRIARATGFRFRKVGERYVGRCPFHGPDNNPSFNVYRARDGHTRWKCFSCLKRGDDIDWLRLVEKKTWKEAGGTKPEPELILCREAARRREEIRQLTLDAYPDLPPEAEMFITADDTLTLLQLRLRRHLKGGNR